MKFRCTPGCYWNWADNTNDIIVISLENVKNNYNNQSNSAVLCLFCVGMLT